MSVPPSPATPAPTDLSGGPDRSAGTDWIARAADDTLTAAAERGTRRIVCASGLSPSGPIHLGNLREILTQHFVAEEIRRRGHDCEHLLFWDDYDRLRKLPAGVPESFAEHLGRPLAGVPDPFGDRESWADRFAAPLRQALAALGVEVREISQARRYRSGHYTAPVLRAMAARHRIDAVLSRHRTAGGTDRTGDYHPYRVYCRSCGRDDTTITRYRDGDTRLDYRCHGCGRTDGFRLDEVSSGKLVWKVDWPMRWAAEPVTFEAAGADHASPGSSAVVGAELCRDVFGAPPPVFLGYGFVGTRGMAKLSSSAGGAPTPADALGVLEAPILRWLYVRRRPNQSITVDFGSEVTRLYDEWDRLRARVAAGHATGAEQVTVRRAATTGAGPLPEPAHPVPWRLLGSAIDITADDDTQLLRVLRDADGTGRPGSLAEVEPRRSLARRWVREYLPADQRTRVRAEPARDRLAALAGGDRQAIRLLLAGLADRWSLPGLTALVYGIPKRQHGLPEDGAATAEIKQAQRRFFALLYDLLVAAETGPRLPTLLLALGPDRLRHLLDPPPGG